MLIRKKHETLPTTKRSSKCFPKMFLQNVPSNRTHHLFCSPKGLLKTILLFAYHLVHQNVHPDTVLLLVLEHSISFYKHRRFLIRTIIILLPIQNTYSLLIKTPLLQKSPPHPAHQNSAPQPALELEFRAPLVLLIKTHSSKRITYRTNTPLFAPLFAPLFD